jgi:hypothetical protein
MTSLPSLDFSTEETLAATATARATAAVTAAAGPQIFKGLLLTLTIDRKAAYLMLSRLNGGAEAGGDAEELNAIVLLYLASQDPALWQSPLVEDGRLIEPLRARPFAWLSVIDAWSRTVFTPADTESVVEAANALWTLHHAPRVVEELDPADASDDQKKTASSPPGI